ncbi:MAG: hypothetical protein IH946_05800, partial [Bacteroidetes bacterium]|nr:hypothetical protein [Bacteroidota bacterium]
MLGRYSLPKQALLLVGFILLILMPVLSLDFGISGDEVKQYDYGKKIIRFYTSFGQDLENVKFRKHYGGLFDISSTVISKLLPSVDPYTIRHI